MNLNLIHTEYLSEYKKQLNYSIDDAFKQLSDKPQTEADFKFYLANSAVHSSNIEGNTVSFDTYLKASEHNLHLKTKEIKEIEELINAYQFARENELTLNNTLKAHEIITTSILVKKERGKLRKVKVGVRNEGKLIYLAIEPEFIKAELEKLFNDIAILLSSKLTIQEIFIMRHPFIWFL